VVRPFQKLPNEIIDSIINQITKQQRILRHLIRNHVILYRVTRYKVIVNECYKQQQTLYQCTLVSKQFYTISNPLLWQEPFLYSSTGQHFITCLFDVSSQQQFETLTQHIQELDVNTEHWTKDYLTRLLPCLTHLTQLQIGGHVNAAVPCLTHQMHHFQHHLTSLQLGSNSTREFFSIIGHHCPQLDELEWDPGETGSIEWLSLLAQCPLKSLYIFTTHVPINETLFRTVQQFYFLTALYMHSIIYPPENFLRLVPNKNAAEWWNQLTRVKFGACSEIDDDSFLGFIKSCPQLEHLDMVHPILLTDTSFDAMAVHLPQLSHLAWGKNKNITPNAIQRLVRGCAGDHLKYIKFTNCALLSQCYFTEWALLESGWGFSYIVLDQQAISKIKKYGLERNNNK
jgi:hypothetical protein